MPKIEPKEEEQNENVHIRTANEAEINRTNGNIDVNIGGAVKRVKYSHIVACLALNLDQLFVLLARHHTDLQQVLKRYTAV